MQRTAESVSHTVLVREIVRIPELEIFQYDNIVLIIHLLKLECSQVEEKVKTSITYSKVPNKEGGLILYF